MALNWETVPIAFTQGLDTRTNKKLVIPGKWLDLMNVTLGNDNTPQTRDGHAALIGTNNGNSLFTRGNELLTISGRNVSSISPNTSSAVSMGGVPGYVGISKTEIQRNTGMQDMNECASNGTLTCYVWRSRSNINTVLGFAMTLVDEASGTKIQSNVTLHTNINSDWIRVVAASDAFYIIYRDGNNMLFRVIQYSAPATLGAETTLISSASLSGACAGDACAFASMALVAYPWGDGTTSVRCTLVAHTGTTPSLPFGTTNAIDQTSLQIAGVTAVTCCLYGNGTKALIAATGNLGTKSGMVGAVVDSTIVVTTAATRLSATTSTTTANNHLCAIAETSTTIRIFRDFISEITTNSFTNILQQTVNTTLATIGGPNNVRPSATFGAGVLARGPNGPFIYGKPFTNGTNIFLPAFVFSVYNNISSSSSNPRNANTQNTFFLIDCGHIDVSSVTYDAAVVCGRALYGTMGLASINGNQPVVFTSSVATVTANSTFALLIGELTMLVLSSGNNISPTGLVRLTLMPNASTPLSHAELGESAYVAGGQLSMYDGQALAEQAFPLFPEGIALTAGVGGNMNDGVHQVVAVYTWVDNAGQRHQSAPSAPVSVTVASGGPGFNTGNITVSVPTLLVSQKTGVEIWFYCTTASGLTFFRALLTGGAYQPLANSTSANALSTYVISESDMALSSNEVLYTQPNLAPTTLPNLAPPPCAFTWTAHRRLWFDKADKPGWFGYSQEYINNVGLQFHDSLEDSLPTESGGFVSGAQMDEKVVIFGRRRIYVMYGTGPNPSGSFNNYSHPIDLQADVGCSDALSVLSIAAEGIIFKSQKGWHVLGRDLSVRYIGEGVAFADAAPVTAAVMLDDRKECRFVLGGTVAAPNVNLSGVTLVFSYLVGQWSYFCQTNGSGYLPVDATWWPVAGSGSGRYVTISLADGTNQDTPGTFIDAPGVQSSIGIGTRYRTSWLHMSKLEGFQRVRWLYISGTAADSPTSQFTVIVNYDDAYGPATPDSYQVVTQLGNAFPAWDVARPIDLRHKLHRMKCKSVAFTFVESAGPSNSRLSGLQVLSLEVGVKKGVNRLPAAQGIG